MSASTTPQPLTAEKRARLLQGAVNALDKAQAALSMLYADDLRFVGPVSAATRSFRMANESQALNQVKDAQETVRYLEAM